jgi:hypothetical protein
MSKKVVAEALDVKFSIAHIGSFIRKRSYDFMETLWECNNLRISSLELIDRCRKSVVETISEFELNPI